MKIEGTNIVTTQNDDRRLYQSLGQKYTAPELDCIVSIIYENRHYPSVFVLELLHAEYKDANLDTIDLVIMWLKEVFTLNGLEIV